MNATQEEIETALKYYRRHLAQKKERYDANHPVENRKPRGRPRKVQTGIEEMKKRYESARVQLLELQEKEKEKYDSLDGKEHEYQWLCTEHNENLEALKLTYDNWEKEFLKKGDKVKDPVFYWIVQDPSYFVRNPI